jgi:hypothetical protein
MLKQQEGHMQPATNRYMKTIEILEALMEENTSAFELTDKTQRDMEKRDDYNAACLEAIKVFDDWHKRAVK